MKGISLFIILLMSGIVDSYAQSERSKKDTLVIPKRGIKKTQEQTGAFYIQGGVGFFDNFGNFPMSNISGNLSKADIIYKPKSNKILSPIIGATLTHYFVEYRPVSGFQYLNGLRFTQRGIGGLIGFEASIAKGNLNFFSNQFIDSKYFTVANYESWGNEIEPTIKKVNASYHMQVGLELISKNKNAFLIVITGGRTLTSFNPDEGYLPEYNKVGDVFPWEIGIMLGIGFPTLASF